MMNPKGLSVYLSSGISQHLLDGLAQNLLETFMFPNLLLNQEVVIFGLK